MRNYQRLVPANSFMGRYLSYMQTQETAYNFDFWCGLWGVSAACGRYIHVARPRAPVYMNMFTILVGESGVARKTTSVSTITRMLRKSGVIGYTNDIGLMDAKVTPERLELTLQERTMELGHASMCISIPELAVFLGTEQYIAHMPTLLTDLYDCPDERDGGGTIVRGPLTIRNIWVSFLSASTPVWLLKTVNPNVVEGGFTSRCYFVISNTPKQSIPWPMAQDAVLYQDLCDDLKIMAVETRSKGTIQVSPHALMVFSEWYRNRHHSLDPFKQSFESREDAHILRVAGLLSVNDGSYCISRAHIRIGIRLIQELKEESGNIFDNAETRTKFAHALDIVRSNLVSAGLDPMSRNKLFTKCRSYVTNGEFLTLIEVLHEIGAIQRFVIKGDGRPSEYYRGTNIMLSKGLGEAVLERFTS